MLHPLGTPCTTCGGQVIASYVTDGRGSIVPDLSCLQCGREPDEYRERVLRQSMRAWAATHAGRSQLGLSRRRERLAMEIAGRLE